MIAAVTLVVLLIFGFYFMGIYNGLVALTTQIERAWSNIDVILKQRLMKWPSLFR